MKKITGFLLFTLATGAFAQTTSSTSTTTLGAKLKKMGLGISLENETNTVRNNENEMAGYTTYFLAEPSLKINGNNTLSVGAMYNMREFEDTKIEDKNRDALSESFIKYTYTALSSKTSAMDLRLQGRLYQNEDSFFRKYYSNDGNYQLRAYMGAPLAGKLFINKYVSYLR